MVIAPKHFRENLFYSVGSESTRLLLKDYGEMQKRLVSFLSTHHYHVSMKIIIASKHFRENLSRWITFLKDYEKLVETDFSNFYHTVTVSIEIVIILIEIIVIVSKYFKGNLFYWVGSKSVTIDEKNWKLRNKNVEFR